MATLMQWTTGVGTANFEPAGLGVEIPRPTTRIGLYDAIDAFLQELNWAKFELSSRDHLYFSDGESGQEGIYFRLRWDGSRYINWDIGTKFNGVYPSMSLGGNLGLGTNERDRWDLTTSDPSGNGFELHFFGTEDFFWLTARRISDGRTLTAFIGRMNRNHFAFPDVHKLQADVTPTPPDLIEIDLDVDLTTLGYKVGDRISLIEQDPTVSARTASCLIKSFTATGVVTDLREPFKEGALVAAAPMPVARFCSGSLASTFNRSIWDNNYWRTPWNPVDGHGEFEPAVWTVSGVDNSFGEGDNPNRRTNRFVVVPAICRYHGILGEIPGVYQFRGNISAYPHDTATRDRVEPVERYVAYLPRNSGVDWVLGPVPVTIP